MKAVIQRVSSASVTVSGEKIGEIGVGLLILLGVNQKDAEKDVDYLVNKTAGLRIFSDDNQHMNLSVQDVSGEALVVSQFTLCADTRKGRRPSFVSAAGIYMSWLRVKRKTTAGKWLGLSGVVAIGLVVASLLTTSLSFTERSVPNQVYSPILG